MSNPCVKTGFDFDVLDQPGVSYTGDLFYDAGLNVLYIRGIPAKCIGSPMHHPTHATITSTRGNLEFVHLPSGYYSLMGNIKIVKADPMFKAFIKEWYPELAHILPSEDA